MRDAPAFQEYAAAMLANSRYRLMSLAERGLLDTLRRECWVNVGVPAKPAALARMLGYESAEIDAALPAIMPFFRITQDGLIVCPELDDLRAAYADRRERQAAGGKRSAEKRKGIKPENGTDDIPSTLQGTSKHPAGSLQVRRQDQTRPDQTSQKQSIGRRLFPALPTRNGWPATPTPTHTGERLTASESWRGHHPVFAESCGPPTRPTTTCMRCGHTMLPHRPAHPPDDDVLSLAPEWAARSATVDKGATLHPFPGYLVAWQHDAALAIIRFRDDGICRTSIM